MTRQKIALRPVGRPLNFETPDDLRTAINKYMARTTFDELSVTGLALAIGSTRMGLTDYAKRDGYGSIIAEAKLYVENSYELSLRKYGRSGDIFALKNFGWTDKTITELQGGLDITAIARTIIEPAIESDS